MFDNISVADLEGAFDLVDKLKQQGLNASCYSFPFAHPRPGELHEAIWVGGSVTPDVAITAIKTAVVHWPSLKYVYLSCDVGSFQPDDVHYVVFIGGLTETALERNCRPWNSDDFQQLQSGMSLPEFHHYVRSFYNTPQEFTTLVRFCGGPWDGQMFTFPYPPEAVPRTWNVERLEYRLRKVGDGYEYHPASVTGEIHPNDIRTPGAWERHQADMFRQRFGRHFIVVYKKGARIKEEHIYDSRSGSQEDMEAAETVVGLLAHDKPVGPNIIGQGIAGVFPWMMGELRRRGVKDLTNEDRLRFTGTNHVTGVSVDDPEPGVTTIYMESGEFLLDVMYPLTLAREMKGWFPLHTPYQSATRREDSIEFLSGDEPGLTPGVAMQSDFYFFQQRDKADASFDYACEQLRKWADSHKGSEYLVKLTQGGITGELLRHYKGKIGVS